MRELSIKFFLPLLFFSLTISVFVYADCEVTPPDAEPQTTGNCMSTPHDTPERKACCAQLYPPNWTDPNGGDPELIRYLCLRAEKMNSSDAATFNQSFTNSPGSGTTPAGRVPIIFLPGIAGSSLQEAANPNNDLWPLALNGDRANLALLPDGIKQVSKSVEVVDVMRSGFKINFYGDFLKSLTNLGYQENVDLYTFPYDWRCSNDSHYTRLDKVIDLALAATGQKKVILIAHSMGGLISRGYIYSSAARAAKVQSFITIGTPYWGAPKVYYAIVNGYNFDNPYVRTHLMKVLAQNWPSAYQLLPRDPFIDGLSLAEANSIQYKWYKQVRNFLVWDSYELTDTNDRFFNPALMKAAENFFARVGTKTDPKPLPQGVQQFVIIGTGISTLGGFTMENWKSEGTYLQIGNRKVILKPKPTDGDSSVPLWSAETRAASATYYIPYKTGFLVDESSKHSQLPDNKTVQSIVARILNNSAPAPAEFPKPAQREYMGDPVGLQEPDKVAELTLHSDAHMRISHESSGLALGFDQEKKIENTLPGTFLEMDGREYASIADLTQTYKVELRGFQEGKFTLEVHVKKNERTYSDFSFNEVKVQNGTYAYFYLTPDHVTNPPPSLQVTTNGQTTSIPAKVGSGVPQATNTLTPGIPTTLYKWTRKGFGDCTSHDVGGTEESAVPADRYCTAQTIGQTAVCWDGEIKHHPNGKIWCTYKNVLAANCTGGGAPGFLYECSSIEYLVDAGNAPPRVPKPETQPAAVTPPVAVTPPPTPPPPQKTSRVPGMWQLVSMEQHGWLDRAPARTGDGDMIFEGVALNENGGEFTARIQTSDVICAAREQEAIHVKWRFNSDIRLLAPGAVVPVTVEVHPISTGVRCPFAALSRTEFALYWGDGLSLLPATESRKYYGFINPQPAPNRRFNFYQMNPEDASATSGYTAFEVTTNIPSGTDPKQGWFGFVIHTNGCCAPPPGPGRGTHGFFYMYEFGGQ